MGRARKRGVVGKRASRDQTAIAEAIRAVALPGKRRNGRVRHGSTAAVDVHDAHCTTCTSAHCTSMHRCTLHIMHSYREQTSLPGSANFSIRRGP